MSDYIKTTNFAPKDSLPSGDPNKIIRAAEIDTEFNAIEVASGTKANKVATSNVGKVFIVSNTGDLQAGTQTPADLLDRANHTGTQTLSTISDSGTLASQDEDDITQLNNLALIAANFPTPSSGTSYIQGLLSSAGSGLSAGTYTDLGWAFVGRLNGNATLEYDITLSGISAGTFEIRVRDSTPSTIGTATYTASGTNNGETINFAVTAGESYTVEYRQIGGNSWSGSISNVSIKTSNDTIVEALSVMKY